MSRAYINPTRTFWSFQTLMRTAFDNWHNKEAAIESLLTRFDRELIEVILGMLMEAVMGMPMETPNRNSYIKV